MRTRSKEAGSARVDDVRARVDAVLERFLAARRTALADADPLAAELVDELRRVVVAGGKRLRPLFCYWGFAAAGGKDDDEIVAAAASLELLHTFAIIHDDVMDRSPRRRGQAATHIALARGGDAHVGMSAAILTGDLALVLSDELFCDAGFTGEPFMSAFRWYHRMRSEVVAGQYLDIAAAGGVASEDEVRRIARLKSGGYTVEKPLLIGAALANASPDVEATLSAYGIALGEAFQLRDDVLGAFGDENVTGKDAHGDLREGKRTLLVARAFAAAGEEDRAFLTARLGDEALTEADATRIREIIRDTGALDAVLATIDELRGTALAALDARVVGTSAAAALGELAGLASIRES
ncbi:MAG: polyprenyl synthetase family protein [Actinomycetota bacterium]